MTVAVKNKVEWDTGLEGGVGVVMGGGGGGGGRGVTALSELLVQNHILPPSPTPWGLSPHQFLPRDHLVLSKSN